MDIRVEFVLKNDLFNIFIFPQTTILDGCPANQYEATEGSCSACPTATPYSHAHAHAVTWVDATTAANKCSASK